MATHLFGLWSQRALTPAQEAMLASDVAICGIGAATPRDPFSAVQGAHAIIAGGGLRYSREVIASAPHLRVISRTGIGCDNVDVQAASERGIAVCNTPDAPTQSTAEHTWALILAATKHLKTGDAALSDGRQREHFSATNALELSGATLGLVGMGRIGALVAKMAVGFDMKVVAYDPYLAAPARDIPGVMFAANLEEMLAQSDVVSLHVPLTPQTRQLFNKARLLHMKPGAYFVNCARGELVDEQALADVLAQGHLGGAAVDVFSVEPPPPSHPLLHREDVFVTPHVAAATIAGKERMVKMAISNALDVLHGRRPASVVNPDAWPLITKVNP
jgi:D-3-phosphoglycerate dehydrogenase